MLTMFIQQIPVPHRELLKYRPARAIVGILEEILDTKGWDLVLCLPIMLLEIAAIGAKKLPLILGLLGVIMGGMLVLDIGN
jgi:hypothetical protein